MRRWFAAAAVVAGLGLLGGCASNSPGDLNRTAAGVLRPAVEAVRVAAAGPSYTALQQAVSQLKQLVRQQERAGNVSSQRAFAIEDAADALLQDARPATSPSPSPSPTSASPTPTPTSPSPTPSESPSTAPPTPSDTSSPIVSVSAKPLG